MQLKIKNLLPIKDILKTLSSSGINNYMKTRNTSVLEIQQLRGLEKWKKKNSARKRSSSVLFIEPCLWY